ncbi:aspartate carbamoyltransferase catalytic subunit [Periweissella beninensis]|uniref:aspartate carbamoyltransferase catalytic subunit n=1 Tax=Periweissella beninensis TaxID=504936 RepID=UPI0021A41EA6|nr:aspartate carbamoyltransferase catalytic subunit [Periweissella beninensis]MCT4396391.1 aspartate carbamoyltransferase catalytic subunit [Periweissella beninensis]
MYNSNFLNINDLSLNQLQLLLDLAREFRKGKQIQLKRPVFSANLFFENSTRTHSSFQMAEKKLGINLIDINPTTSSVQKGETLSDTVKTLQAIGVDLMVIRHHETGWYHSLNNDKKITASLINGGDGSGQHPSQSLLDLLTIYDEFNGFANLTIGIVGDLAHSRVARSNAEILHRLGVRVLFGGPQKWYPKEFDAYGEFMAVDDLIKEVDVLMLLRVQLERLTHEAVDSFTAQNYHTEFGLTLQRYHTMKKRAIIMHPAPVNRDVEIASELVEVSQARIFKQMENGVYARMAIITSILDAKGLIKELPVYANTN